MTPRDRHERLFELFLGAVDLAEPDRSAFLDRECPEPTMREELVKLIDNDDESGLVAAPASEDHQPESIGRYRVLSALGRGGMGTVYLAERSDPKQLVAIKVINREIGSSGMIERFMAERQALANLDHPSIAKLFDAGTTDAGQPYFVMDYCAEHKSITDFCDDHRLGIDARLTLFQEVCSAVQHAHEQGIVHRDLKPSNILVSGHRDQPLVKIIDFGLAKTVAGDHIELPLAGGASGIAGTPEYMSPEQADRDRVVGTRSDVFALGVVLHQLLAGNLPELARVLRGLPIGEQIAEIRGRAADQPSATVRRDQVHADEFAAMLGFRSHVELARFLEGDLDAIVTMATHNDPAARYSSAAQLHADVGRYLRHEPLDARAHTFGYVTKKFVRRHRVAVLGFGVTVTVLIVATIVSFAYYGYFKDLGLAKALRTLQQRELANAPAARPEHLEELRRWVRDVEAIFAERPRLERYLRSRGADSAPEERGPSAQGELSLRIREMFELMDEMQAEKGTFTRVKRRIDWADRVAALTTTHPDWPATIQAVSERYELDLRPQVGLIPLGFDPESGLAEFAFPLPGGTVPERGADGRLTITETSCPVFVLLPGGPFDVGSQDTEPTKQRYDPFREPGERALSRVEIAPFFASKYEFTQGQWKLLRGEETATQFSDELGLDIDLTHPMFAAFGVHVRCLLQAWGMRFPMWHEWEYLARAGSDDPWVFGDRPECLRHRANIADRSLKRAGGKADGTSAGWSDGYPMTAPVGSFPPNKWGIFDAHGNVAEVCAKEQKGLEIRGGSWHQAPTSARFTFAVGWAGAAKPSIGFRPVLSLSRE